MNRQDFPALVLLCALACAGTPGTAAGLPRAAGCSVTADTPTLSLTHLPVFPASSMGEVIREGVSSVTFSNPDGPKQLTARLVDPPPPGIRVEVEVLSGAMSTGRRTLSTRAVSLAFHLPAIPEGTLGIRYRLVQDITTPPGAYSLAIAFTLLDH